jgi:hypothetical protein
MHMNVINISVRENTWGSKKIARPTPQTPFFLIAESQFGRENINIIMEYVQSCQR